MEFCIRDCAATSSLPPLPVEWNRAADQEMITLSNMVFHKHMKLKLRLV